MGHVRSEGELEGAEILRFFILYNISRVMISSPIAQLVASIMSS